MPEDTGPWLSIAEVATLLKVHHNTVRRLIGTGRLPATRLGGPGSTVRIATSDLEAFLHRSRIDLPDPIGE
jgi:excisionase family DNA binding protein